MKFFSLFFTVGFVLLVSSSTTEYEWSGFVNLITENFDFVCPNNFPITGVASEFYDVQNDRRWEYQCSSGSWAANFSYNCSLQDPINEYSMEFNFECSNDGYIAGFMSTFSDSEDDRQWYPNCCTRTYSSLVDCDIPSSSWENNVELLLNWTTSSDRVLTGAQSFYSPFNRDRRWRFRQCKLAVNCGDPGMPENAMRIGEKFLYQDNVTFICNDGYYQSSGPEGGVRYCLDTGLWSDTQPQCQSINSSVSELHMSTNHVSLSSSVSPIIQPSKIKATTYPSIASSSFSFFSSLTSTSSVLHSSLNVVGISVGIAVPMTAVIIAVIFIVIMSLWRHLRVFKKHKTTPSVPAQASIELEAKGKIAQGQSTT